ncbi:hypothetical protein JKF63_05828 [Porcisia hertigi]|uniref:Uncharacterized protein n=1 Tax=Porcisia hertigi TaxID=2761500 RepID=A0A836LE34_9TRYP|nr:hypothetical protein JKF63_05828 [Porcisia hertigi]
MSHEQFFWFSSFLSDAEIRGRGVGGGGQSDSNDSCDQAVEVFYDDQCDLPRHDLTEEATVRGDDNPAYQSPQLVSGYTQQHPPDKQASCTSLTSSLDNAHKSSTDTFPVSTFTSRPLNAAAPAAPSSKPALIGLVDADVVTMDHAVRVPSALLSAGRRTMFDVLAVIAARQRGCQEPPAKGQESTEAKKLVSEENIATKEALSPDTASSARQFTYQTLFPRAAAAARLSSSTATTSSPAVGSSRELSKSHTVAPAPPPVAAMTAMKAKTADTAAVEPPLPSGSTSALRSTLPTTHPRSSPSSSRPPEPGRPDRRLRHLLPAHLRGGPSKLQSADDDSHSHKRQTEQQGIPNRQPPRHVDHRTGVVVPEVSDISSISSWSDEDDTVKVVTQHPQPHRETRRAVTGSAAAAAAAAPTLSMEWTPSVTRPTALSERVDNDAGELASLNPRHEEHKLGRPERPQGAAEESEKKWAQMDRVLMAVTWAATSSHAGKLKLLTDSHSHGRDRHHGARGTTTIPNSKRDTQYITAASASPADSAKESSDTDDSGYSGRGVVNLLEDLEDEVPRWVRQHEATHERLAEKQKRQWQRASWISPTFSETHMSVIEKVAAADKARAQQAAATADASQAFMGKPLFFCPSSTTTRTRSAGSHTAGGPAYTEAVRSAESYMDPRRQNARGALTATATTTATGGRRSLVEVWKERKRLLQQRSSNATAVSVVEYLWQRFQAWKPYGLQLLRHLRSGTCIGEASPSPARPSLSHAQHESGPTHLPENPVRNDAGGDASETIGDEISATSSDEHDDQRSNVKENVGRHTHKPSMQVPPVGLPSQRSSRGIAGHVTEATHQTDAPNKHQRKTCGATRAELASIGDEGIELQVRVQYIESSFNVVAVQGDLTYASESACALMGLDYPFLSTPCSSARVTGREEDSRATPATRQRGWTILVPEPALMEVPMVLGEHLYLAPPYTVFRELRAVLSSYNFTTDALLRQCAAEEEALQGERRQRRGTLDAFSVADVGAPKANASSRVAAVAGRAAVYTVLDRHGLESGYGESGGHQGRLSPTRRRSPCEDADSREETLPCWTAPDKNDGTPFREVSATRAQTLAPLADTPATNRTPTALGRGDGDPAGASPDPHLPVSRCPQQPQPQASGAAIGIDAADAKTRSRRGVPPGHSSLSPSYVRASTAGVDSLSVEGFYDPLAMPALPLTGTNERWSGSRGGGTNGLAPNIPDETMVLSKEPGRGIAGGGSRELPIPPPMVPHPIEGHLPHGAAEVSAGVPGSVVAYDAGARGSDTLAPGISSVTTAGIGAPLLVSDPVGGGFPRGPTADWDVPVEVLFALSGGDGELGGRTQQDAVRHACQYRDAEDDSISEGYGSDEAPRRQQDPARLRHMGTIPAKCAREPGHAHKRYRQETPRNGDAFTTTAFGRASSGLETSTASQVASSGMPLSVVTSSLSTTPLNSSFSSLSEPEGVDDDDAGSGRPAYAACVPRRPRHSSRRGGLGRAFSRREQQYQQERWMRELWGRGTECDEPSALPTARPTLSAWTHTPSGPSRCSQDLQRKVQPQALSMVHASKSCSTAADVSISALRAVSASSIMTPMARRAGGHSAAIPAHLSSPLVGDARTLTELHVDHLTNSSAHGVVGAPVLHHTDDAEASTATTGFFSINEVYLSDTD